jgi:membrane protein YqaA with SNARE-associated domain
LVLRGIYDWTLQKAAAPAAEAWLATIAFIESSVFLIPADVLFVPMALAKPARAYWYALTVTLASTLGGIAGYYLGHYAYEEIAKPILAFYGKLHTFEQLRSSGSRDAVLLMLVTSGLAHMPPIKVMTILSGAVEPICGYSLPPVSRHEAHAFSHWPGRWRAMVSRSATSLSAA